MKKELPKIFQNQIEKNICNNKNVFYGKKEERSEKKSVNELFKINQIYRTNVKITTHNKTVEKKVIGRTENNLITSDNEIIAISDIVDIEEL